MSFLAQKIMLLRHAEKPGVTDGGSGVGLDGTEDPESLTVRGWVRAGALVSLFAPTYGGLQSARLERPRLVFAAGVGEHSPSRRAQETIQPLCEKLGITASTDYLKEDFEAMTDEALSHDGPVLVCWQHLLLPAIASRILGDTTTAPQASPEDRFDVIWVLDRDRATGRYHFEQVPQTLLAGDLPGPIA